MTGGGQGLFIDGGSSGDSTTSDGLDRLESNLRLTTNKERILHHNLELYLIREMSCTQEHSRSFRKVPEPSGTFLVCVVCKNIPEASGRFRNLPEPSGTFLVGNCIYGMSCIALYGLCYENDFPPKKVPEPSGTFRNLLSLCCMQEHSRSFRKVPEPSGTFRNILSRELYLWNELYCIIWVVLRKRRFPKEGSGTFRKVLECSLHSTHSFHVILLHFNVSPKNAPHCTFST